MYGFTSMGDMSDHDFARWLRKHRAINNYQNGPANSAKWFGPDATCVALCIYDNTRISKRVFLLSDLVELTERRRIKPRR